MKAQLPTVTIMIVDTVNYGQAIRAIQKCRDQVDAHRIVFLTDIDVPNPDGFEVVQIPSIKSKEEYSDFMIRELYKHFDSPHCLVIQHDGYILDGGAWLPEFLKYDYIGAPWVYEHNRNIGNGGFSLRSLKMQKILGTDPMITTTHHEDQSIGIIYRKYLEDNYDIKFPEEDLADMFSFELREPIGPTFGFHGHFHVPFRPTVVIKRSGAMGDIVAIEPVLKYYFDKGLHVAVDVPTEFYYLFYGHMFPVKHITQLDHRLHPIIIDLDMSYENKPKQLHLQSYFETCKDTYSRTEIPKNLERPRLTFPINAQNKMFKKYAVLHIDKREQPGRNIYGVAWHTIISELVIQGYDVIQIGKNDHDETSALFMNTPTINMMMWLIAGADLFIGADSGPSHIAVAFGIPAIIFFGQVDPNIIHPDLSNVKVITTGKVCDKPFCWHETVTTTGQDCYIDKVAPPCVQFKTLDVINSIHKFIKL